MERWWLALSIAAAGCNQVFSLDQTKLSDGSPCPSPDEDGDCVDDSHDNCPGLANPDQADTDKDGIGDICDFDPSSRGAILAFYPFRGSDAMDWMASAGWTLDLPSGSVHHADDTDTSLLSRKGVDAADDLTVEATFVYHATAGQNPSNRMGVWTDTPFAQENGQTCWIDAANSVAEVQESVTVTGAGNAQSISTLPLADGQRYTVQLHRVVTAQRLDCAIYLGTTRSQIPTDTGTAPWVTSGHTAISANGVAADLLDVVIYGPSL